MCHHLNVSSYRDFLQAYPFFSEFIQIHRFHIVFFGCFRFYNTLFCLGLILGVSSHRYFHSIDHSGASLIILKPSFRELTFILRHPPISYLALGIQCSDLIPLTYYALIPLTCDGPTRHPVSGKGVLLIFFSFCLL